MLIPAQGSRCIRRGLGALAAWAEGAGSVSFQSRQHQKTPQDAMMEVKEPELEVVPGSGWS